MVVSVNLCLFVCLLLFAHGFVLLLLCDYLWILLTVRIVVGIGIAASMFFLFLLSICVVTIATTCESANIFTVRCMRWLQLFFFLNYM